MNYINNKLHYLCDVPQIIRDMQLMKATNVYGNNAKGTKANKELNKWGRKLQADWQLSKAITQGDEDEMLNLHTLRGLAYIEECIRWNSDGNFDRVSSGGMLFILREDRAKMTVTAIENKDKLRESIANDSFFTKNYRPRTAMQNRINY